MQTSSPGPIQECDTAWTELTRDGIAIYESGKIIDANTVFARMFGYESPEIIGKDCIDFLATPSRGMFVRESFAVEETAEALGLRRDRSVFPIELADRAYLLDGRPVRVVNIRDISRRKEFEIQLLHDAFHDALTGLPNRALFMERLGEALDLSKRRTGYSFAVIFLDLDHFKLVNDSLGHLAGDQLLIIVARRFKKCLRPGDVLARIGGDEFTVLLEDVSNIEEALQIARRLQVQLEHSIQLDGQEVFAGASIGIAMSADWYDRADNILRDADTAMYHAKSSGRNRLEVFDGAMHAKVMSRLQLDTDLRHALQRGQFRVLYQPIVGLESRQTVGFEALVRWDRPQHGLVPPAEFVPVAEESGLIVELDRWVLREACRQTALWQREHGANPPLSISVNFSGKHFSQPDVVDFVKATLEATGLQPTQLRIEITENVIIEHATPVRQAIEQLEALGVLLYIDDFGTGYSSLSYLHRFPVHTLKIDRSFVSRMETDEDASEIVRAIVALARNLGIDVIAEGVETQAQCDALRDLDCKGQGYLFARPLDADSARQFLTSGPCAQ